jgi:hypothetical protein
MTTKSQLQEIYIGLLGRAADPAGLDYWANEIDTGALTLDQVRANIVSEQPEFEALFAGKTRAQIVDQLYVNLFARSAEPAGLEYWVNGDGKNVPIDQLVFALSNGAGVVDRLALDNKIEVAQYYTDNADPFVKSVADSIIDGVTSQGVTVSDAKSAIDALNSSAGQTFVLTDSTDFLVGTAGNDLFIGRAGVDNDNPTASATGDDVIDGAGGYNTLRVSLYDSDDDPGLLPQTTNVQRLELLVNYDDRWSVAAMDGLEVVALRDTITVGNTRDVRLEGFSELVDAELNNTNQKLEFRYGTGLAAGDADETTLTLSRAISESFYNNFGANFKVDLFGAGEAIETLNVVSTGPVANWVKIEGNAAYETLNFSGAQDLEVGVFDDPGTVKTITTSGAAVDLLGGGNRDFSGLEVIDASQSTGGLSVFSSSDDLESVAGGAGDDDFELTGAVALAEIHMGEGDNRLVIRNIDVAPGILGTTVSAGAGDDVILLGGEDSLAEGFLTVDAGAGDNRIEAFADGNVTVTTLDGDDEILAYSNSDIVINAGDGSNVVEAGGFGEDSSVSVTTGEGEDFIGVSATGDVVVDAGAGDNSVFVEALGTVAVTSLDGDDSVQVFAFGDVSVDVGAGDNEVFVLSGGDIDVVALDGDDEIFAITGGEDAQGSITVDAGDGNNAVQAVSLLAGEDFIGEDFIGEDLGDGDITVTTGSGNDSIFAVTSGGDVVVDAGDGDNYVLAATDATVNVTVGAGNDHVDVTWASLTAEGSSVALGDGFNTLGILDGTALELATGEDGSSDETWLNAFDAAELPVTGTVDRLELLNAFDLNDSVNLDVSGFEGTVSEIFFGDVDNESSPGEDAQYDLTITGMGGDVLIQSGDEFELNAGDLAENAGRLTVVGATSITIEASVDHVGFGEDGVSTERAGTWSDGQFTVVDGFNGNDGDVEFNLGVGNATLTSLNVAAEDDVDVFISDNDDSVAFNIGAINLFSSTNDAELKIFDNEGTSITVGELNAYSRDDSDLEIRRNDGADISIGNVTLFSRDDADVFIYSNTDSNITLGDVAITVTSDNDSATASFTFNDNASTALSVSSLSTVSAYDAELEVLNNDLVTVDFGAISIDAVENVRVDVGSNRNSDITVESLTLTSDFSRVDIFLSNNELTDSLAVDGDMFITVTGDVDVEAGGDIELDIRNNNDNSVERDLVIDLAGAVSLNAIDGFAVFSIAENDDATMHLRGPVSVTSGGDFERAEVTVSNNDDSTIRFYDTVTVTATGEASDAEVYIYSNDDARITFDGELTIVSQEDDARLDIIGNDSGSSIRLLGGVTLEAADDISVEIIDNDQSTVVISGVTASSSGNGDVVLAIVDNDDGSVVRTGDVMLTAGGSEAGIVALALLGNDSAEVTLGDVSLSAAGEDAFLAIQGNDSSEITLGDVDMVGTSGFFEIGGEDFLLGGEDNFDSTIVVGDVTIEATDGDVDFEVYGSNSGSVTLGDVTVHATDDVDFTVQGTAFGFFGGEDSEVEFGDVYVRAGAESDGLGGWVDTAFDSANVDFYMNDVTGTQTIHLQTNGGEGSTIDAFIGDTPDLHTVTMVGGGVGWDSSLEVYGNQGNLGGVFTIDMSGLTSDVFVRTVSNLSDVNRDSISDAAAFDEGTVVRVLIGSGDTAYNVEEVSAGYLFTGSAAGLVSTGARDLTPVELSKTFALQNNGSIGNDQAGTYTFNVNLNGESYAGSVTISDNDDGVGTNIVQSWNLPTLPSGYSFGTSGNSFTISGPASGAGSASVTTAVKTSGSGNGTIGFNTSGTDGTMVTDGRGLVEREIFTFTGDDIGDVVIGGFIAGAWNQVSPANEQITDRLDFGQFAGVSSLDDMIFTIDDTGPVSNVVIDFVDQSLGSITLVGVGEYDDAITAVQSSILFG